jgi:hypothetical protein
MPNRLADFSTPLTLRDRAELYNIALRPYSKGAPLEATGRWLYGVWMMGNNYRKETSYYGGYPASYLKRVLALFPDKDRILHLFSGKLGEGVRGDRLDINPDNDPDIEGDAEDLSQLVSGKYDLIVADPPYSEEDALHYGTAMVNRNKVVEECAKVLRRGGFLVWLDQVLPMFRKADLELVGVISVVISTNHRVRCTFIWERPAAPLQLDAFFSGGAAR